MRAIIKVIDGKKERFLSETDIASYVLAAKTQQETLTNVIAEYMTQTAELTTAWEAFRKDTVNLQKLFEVSTRVNNLANLTLAVQETGHELP